MKVLKSLKTPDIWKQAFIPLAIFIHKFYCWCGPTRLYHTLCLGSRIFTLLYYCQSDKTGLRNLLEAEKINKIADDIRTEASERSKVSEAKAKLAIELNQAIAALDKAQSDQQHQQYQHSLNLIRQQSEMQRQQYQVASLVAQKQEIESKLREITQIKSPVAGKVRRIKNLGQKDRQISLEVVIDVNVTANWNLIAFNK